MSKVNIVFGMYEIKTQFRLILGLEAEYVPVVFNLDHNGRAPIFMPCEDDWDIFDFNKM